MHISTIEKQKSGWFSRLAQTCLITISVAIIIALISGCSVYESQGRKSFEDRAGSGYVNRQNVSSVPASASALPEENPCWTQPRSESLWSLPENSQARVQSINPDIIEVCLEASTSSSNN